MRVTHKTHPELWDVSDLPALSRITGVVVDEEKFNKNIEEAKTIFAHLSQREQEILAIHIAISHPGFSKPKQEKPMEEIKVPRNNIGWWVWVLLAVSAVLLGIMLTKAAKAQDKKEDPAKEAPAPLANVPLEDAEKVQFLKLINLRASYIQKQQADQLEIEKLDKMINDVGTQINQQATEIATAKKIDTVKMILDLDRLEWIPKPQQK